MSFVRNFEDNQSPTDAGGIGPAPQSIPSERASAKVTTTFSPVADTFVRNFSDNQSPADGDSPNASVAAVPGSLAGASDAMSGDRVASYAATQQGVERTMDKMTSSSKTDVREASALQADEPLDGHEQEPNTASITATPNDSYATAVAGSPSAEQVDAVVEGEEHAVTTAAAPTAEVASNEATQGPKDNDDDDGWETVTS
ncbi:hypothetical protein FRC04_004877, partial [Tulasnella sp. 424]